MSADAKGLLKSTIRRDDNPILFSEDKMVYPIQDSVPDGDYADSGPRKLALPKNCAVERTNPDGIR